MAKNSRAFKKKIAIHKKTIGSTKFEIPITMSFDGIEATYYAEYSGKFYFSFKSKILSELYDLIDARLLDTAKIIWEPFIELKFEGRAFTYDPDEKKSYHGDNALNKMKMELITHLIEIGKDIDGKLWSRNQNSERDFIHPYSEKNGMQKQRWAGSGLSGSPKSEHDDEILLTTIPDTPANRKALEVLINNFERLRIALFDLVAPDQIQKTIERSLKSSNLLPGLSEK